MAGPLFDTTANPHPTDTITVPDVIFVQVKLRLIDDPEVPSRTGPTAVYLNM